MNETDTLGTPITSLVEIYYMSGAKHALVLYARLRTIFSRQIRCNSRFSDRIFLTVYARGDLVMSRINPHVAAYNARIAESSDVLSRRHYLQITTRRNETCISADQSHFQDSSPFSFYIKILKSGYRTILSSIGSVNRH